ncbi:Cytidine deaminase 5 [Chamberlinius hualienensis]
METILKIVCFLSLLAILNCQETEEIRRRRQNAVFFGLTGLDRTIPFDLDAFFEQAAPTKTNPKAVQSTRPQRAFTTTTTTTELPSVRRTTESRFRLFNPRENDNFQTDNSFTYSRASAQQQRQQQQQQPVFESPRGFQSEPITVESPRQIQKDLFTTSADQIEGNLRGRVAVSPAERSRQSSFRSTSRQQEQQPTEAEQRPVATFDFSSLDVIQPEVTSREESFRPSQRQPSFFRNSFAPSAETDGTDSDLNRGREFLETSTEDGLQEPFQHTDSRQRFRQHSQEEEQDFRPRQFSRPSSVRAEVEPQPTVEEEIPTTQFDQFDFNPVSRPEKQDEQNAHVNGGEVFDEDNRSENPRSFERPTTSAELGFDDQFQSTEGNTGAEQFDDNGQFQDDGQQQHQEQPTVQREQPQRQQTVFRQPSSVERDEKRHRAKEEFTSTSPDDHSNFPEVFFQPVRQISRPAPQHFPSVAPAVAPPVSNRHFPSTVPVDDIPRQRAVDTRHQQQSFDSSAIRKPFQEATTFRDSQSFHPQLPTHFRTFEDEPQQQPQEEEPEPLVEDKRQFVSLRPTRPSVRVEPVGQISSSFVRATEPTDFTDDTESEFTSSRISASTKRPRVEISSTRRFTTAKPLRRKSFTRRPTAATPFENRSSASASRPSEATTASFRFPSRNNDRSRTLSSNAIRGNRIFNNGGASATENTIDDSFSPGFTPQAVSRDDSRGSGSRPKYGDIATACYNTVCQLPNCFCGGNQVSPGNLQPEEIPQIVVLTFDDAVNDLNWKLYTRLYFQDRKNPNGCPIKSTFYVSHEWTDYSKVQNLYASGHEIASHSISHGDGRDYSKKKWYNEIYGQREILSSYANVDIDDVKGMRSPFLAMGGDKQFSMLYETNFTYESSMTVTDVHPPFWPYTLDYAVPHRCAIPPCPKQSYPGFWEIPMVALTDLNGGKCSMADSCSFATTEDGIYDMLMKNFERHYRSNRAPFGLYYHASWFLIPHRQEGFVKFLDEILKKDDVYLVTALQALEWIKNPTPISDIKRFGPWGCNDSPKTPKCERPRSCELKFNGEIRYMSTCNACPSVYPWVGDTGVSKHKHTLQST